MEIKKRNPVYIYFWKYNQRLSSPIKSLPLNGRLLPFLPAALLAAHSQMLPGLKIDATEWHDLSVLGFSPIKLVKMP